MPSVIARFNEAVRTKNAALNADLFAEDVRLYGVLWKPFESKAAAFAVFAMLQEIIEDLEYVAEYEGTDCVALRARGVVGGREFDGVQLLRFNDEGLIDECHDLIRPHSAGTALLEQSAAYFERNASDLAP
jgi:SnoaL-like domain